LKKIVKIETRYHFGEEKMKYLLCYILLTTTIFLSATTVTASDFSFYMWDQEISGTAMGQDSSVPGSTTRVEATLANESNNEKGFRLITKFLGLPTEFGYSTMSNSTSLNADGTFNFNGKEFDFNLPMDYEQDATIFEFFPRIPVFSNDKIGINLLFGVKYMDFRAEINGTEAGGGLITEALDEGIPIPQIGARFFIGSLKKGLRIELMAKHLDIEVSGTNVKSLDAEVIAYFKTVGGIDFFMGWRMMDQTIIVDEDQATEAGVAIKNSGLMYGGRIRF